MLPCESVPLRQKVSAAANGTASIAQASGSTDLIFPKTKSSQGLHLRHVRSYHLTGQTTTENDSLSHTSWRASTGDEFATTRVLLRAAAAIEVDHTQATGTSGFRYSAVGVPIQTTGAMGAVCTSKIAVTLLRSGEFRWRSASPTRGYANY